MGKIIYNSKQVANSTCSYNSLDNKPMINMFELTGNVTLNDINVYSKQQVDEKIREIYLILKTKGIIDSEG